MTTKAKSKAPKNANPGITLWIVEGGVDLKIRTEDNTYTVNLDANSVNRENKADGDLKHFTFNKRQCTLQLQSGLNSKHGDDGFRIRMQAKGQWLRLYPQAKGHFFGSFEGTQLRKASTMAKLKKAAA